MAGTLEVQITHAKIKVGDTVTFKVSDIDNGGNYGPVTATATVAGAIAQPIAVNNLGNHLVRITEIEADGWVVKETELEIDVVNASPTTTPLPFPAKKLRKRPSSANAANRDDDLEVQLTKDILNSCCNHIDRWMQSGLSIDAVQQKIQSRINKLVSG